MVRLGIQGTAGKIIAQRTPPMALSRQTVAKRGARRRSSHHKTKRPTTENKQVTPAASLVGERRRGSMDHSVKMDNTSNPSNKQIRTQKSTRCDAIASGLMLPNDRDPSTAGFLV
jgi:hypothetical protein